MSRPATATSNLDENPIRIIRQARNWTLEVAAGLADVHPQLWYLTECGLYANISPRLLRFFMEQGIRDSEILKLSVDYSEWVKDQRLRFGKRFTITLGVLGDFSFSVSPVSLVHNNLGLSQTEFGKRLCLHPSLMYRVVRGKARNLPGQFRQAFQDAGVDEDIVDELNDRTEEFYRG